MLLEDVAGVEVAIAAATRICAAAEQPMVLPDGYELVAGVSVGIALTEAGRTADDVLRNADVAMYEAKAKGGGGIYRVFDKASMGTRSSERLQDEADLRKGLERDELEVHYQPFYSLDGRHILGIGLNVNNSLAHAPPEVRTRATSIFDLTGFRQDRTAVLLGQHCRGGHHRLQGWPGDEREDAHLQAVEHPTKERSSQDEPLRARQRGAVRRGSGRRVGNHLRETTLFLRGEGQSLSPWFSSKFRIPWGSRKRDDIADV